VLLRGGGGGEDEWHVRETVWLIITAGEYNSKGSDTVKIVNCAMFNEESLAM